MSKERCAAATVLACFAVIFTVSGKVVSSQFPWRSTIKYQTLSGPNNRFTLEYPTRDWQVLPGGGSVVLTLAQKNNEATVVIDYMRMGVELRPDEIAELFANLEAQHVAERQPDAKDVKAVLTGTPTGRIVVLNYLRPGLRGTERVVQYSIPIAQDLYRVICSAPIVQFKTYEPIFTHIAYSFRFPGGASTGLQSEMVQTAVSKTDRIEPPRKTKDARPVYPPEALKTGLQGEVVIEATIGPDGKVTGVRVIESTSSVFDAAAMDAVRRWEFTPTLVDGVPTPVTIRATVTFRRQ